MPPRSLPTPILPQPLRLGSKRLSGHMGDYYDARDERTGASLLVLAPYTELQTASNLTATLRHSAFAPSYLGTLDQGERSHVLFAQPPGASVDPHALDAMLQSALRKPAFFDEYPRAPLTNGARTAAPPPPGETRWPWMLAGTASFLAFGLAGYVGSRWVLADDQGTPPTPAPAVPSGSTPPPPPPPPPSAGLPAAKGGHGPPTAASKSTPGPHGSIGPGGACHSTAECAKSSNCEGGTCQCSGGSDAPRCNGLCALYSDADTCGSCSNRCAADQTCTFVEGSYQCRGCVAPLANCGALHSCFDLDTSDKNCGRCGNACADGSACLGGTCSKQVSVGGTCTGTAMCERASATCQGGRCACSSTAEATGGKCVDCPGHKLTVNGRCPR